MKTVKTFEVMQQQYRKIPEDVIEDLAGICFANAETFHADPRVDARQQGRRDVWLHINRFLGLSLEQLRELAAGKGVYIDRGN